MAAPEPKPTLRAKVGGEVALAVSAAGALSALAAVALVARAQSAIRRRRGAKPRLVWGPVPLISIKYWSEAMRRRGYASTTCVYAVPSVLEREDFDVCWDSVRGSPWLTWLLRDYLALGWALLNADVFFCFFEGGFLFGSRWKRLESPLLKLAGKRLVVSPYGGDVAVPGYLGAAEERLLEDYPVFHELGPLIKERADRISRSADVVVRNYQYGYVPNATVIWPTELAIDTDHWPARPPGGGDGRDGPVTIVHAPNHRRIKGTDVLLRAVQELREEGLKIELDLLERRPNEEVRKSILAADVVADQFVAGYAMFAIEGMSAGKPVLSAVSAIPADVLATQSMRECPLVDVDLASLKQEVRKLVESPDERTRIGAAGREFVERYHSLDAVGRTWEVVLDHLWRGAPLPSRLPPESGDDASDDA